MRVYSLFILAVAIFAVGIVSGCAKTEDPGPTTPPVTSEKPADDKAAAGVSSNGPDITPADSSDVKVIENPAPKEGKEPIATNKPVEPAEKPADDANKPIPALKDASGKTVYPRDKR